MSHRTVLLRGEVSQSTGILSKGTHVNWSHTSAPSYTIIFASETWQPVGRTEFNYKNYLVINEYYANVSEFVR